MEFSGTVPMDAPDPRIEYEARLHALPFGVFELVPQPSLTRLPMPSFSEMIGAERMLSASFSYAWWRFPDDHSDPRNEIELDERTRRSIEEEPAWGRPTWLIEQAQLLRYPMLWEATRTTWHASPDDSRASLARELVDHANHVLINRFRTELGIPSGPRVGEAWKTTVTAVSDASATVDGAERPAVQIDTDPFVFAIGFRVDEHIVCTTVVPRDALESIDLALTTCQ
ncbi:hypothetical protein [Microbacterium sp. NPDC087665]|uniref:hypothetical protein n=1 Tax=Microbacterium sp. NPDC087665 TaxID=3364194 RepID=UPI003813D0ED